MAYDLRVFFRVVAKEPETVTTGDVLGFITEQRRLRRGDNVVRIEDGEAGLSARTIKRRLSSLSGLFAYLVARDDVAVSANPVPRGLATRRSTARRRGVPLIRAPRTLPKLLEPDEVDRLLAALRTRRDRAMVEAMLLGGLRRCETLGLRFEDVRPGEHRLFVAEGKGGHQRLIPVSPRFFDTLADYLAEERPAADSDQLFVVLKGPTRGAPLSPSGLDQVLRGARQRAGLDTVTCHMLRHTCLTRLREAGMALEAVQAQAGHRFDRDHPDLSATVQRMAGGRVPPGVGDPRSGGAHMISPLPTVDDALVAFAHAYGEHHIRRSEASRFATAYGSLADWRALSLDERLSSPPWAKPMICWAVLTRRLDIDVDYVVACRSRWGASARRLFPDDHARFLTATDELGFDAQETRVQWSMLIKTIAAEPTAASPLTVDDRTFTTAADQVLAAVKRHRRSLPKSFSTPMFGLQATLFHLGTLQQPPRKRAGKPTSRTSRWEPIETAAPLLAATMLRYLEQIALSLRPGTVGQADTSLRAFAGWLTDHHPQLGTIAAIRREHIEAYKTWLHRQDGYQGRKLSAATISHRLGDLRSFLDRIIEWGWPDAPDRPLIFLGDFPRPDRPLPRFLDDGAAAKLLAAARSHPDPFVQLVVEMLARTGLRTGELLDLTTDAVVQIGTHHWLRVPIGKLHTDRYIPLHSAVKALLDNWIAGRPDTLRTNLLFIDRGRRIPRSRLQHALADCAIRAGLGHVTPHQLRHTLATQAVNRGMSLEAIASLLGHQSLTMTMVYARIADRTVADEYFNVTEQIEALYQRPHELPGDAEGDNMRRLRTETERRLLGNGWCTRPREIDCRYETICETCSFFATNIEFRPTLQAQHDDAINRSQHDRVMLYQNLLTQLDDETA